MSKQRESAMQTCFERSRMLIALRAWLEAYDGDGSTGRQERDLATATRRYFARTDRMMERKPRFRVEDGK
jgi:hypothetical protein